MVMTLFIFTAADDKILCRAIQDMADAQAAYDRNPESQFAAAALERAKTLQTGSVIQDMSEKMTAETLRRVKRTK